MPGTTETPETPETPETQETPGVPEMPDEPSSSEAIGHPAAGVSVPARITLFGFDDVPADARIEARSVGWRAQRTVIALGAGLVVAPIAGLVPPHAPWALGALGIGILTARRRWVEEHTLHSLEGSCPRCGAVISLSRPVRLRHPHPTSCPSCLYELAVRVDL